MKTATWVIDLVDRFSWNRSRRRREENDLFDDPLLTKRWPAPIDEPIAGPPGFL